MALEWATEQAAMMGYARKSAGKAGARGWAAEQA